MKKQVFQNEEEFQKIYDECLERMPNAPAKNAERYELMQNAFDEYMDAHNEYVFRSAYQLGYEAAVEVFSREPAEHEQPGAKDIQLVQVSTSWEAFKCR